MTGKSNPWFAKMNPSVEAPVRLLCFPSSGAGANMYREWEKHLQNVEVYGAQLPGRERRMSERAIDNVHALVENLLVSMRNLRDKPIILFGHSMGALIAYELTCALERQGQRLPEELIVSAFRTPERINRSKQLHTLEYDEFVIELKKYGGTPEAVLSHRETMELLVPTLRADFKIHETYVFPNNKKLATPITALVGDNDHVVPASHMLGWNNHTGGEYQHHVIEGGHFFIHENRGKCLEIIQNSINQSIANELFCAM